MLEATVILLSAVVLFLLLKNHLDREISRIKLNAKRAARARSRSLESHIATSQHRISNFLETLEEVTQEMRLQTDAAVTDAQRALKAAAEMSSRFDRGETPRENRPIYSLQEIRSPADQRTAAKKARIESENQARMLAEAAEIQNTQVVTPDPVP